jgi:hypothetical protein
MVPTKRMAMVHMAITALKVQAALLSHVFVKTRA